MAEAPDILTGDDGTPFVPIEEKHGDDCTCKPMGAVHVDLVAASRLCPGDRNPHRAGTIATQLEPLEPTPYPGIGIDITWPPPSSDGTPMRPWKMLVHDHVTTRPLLAITGLRIVLGGDQWDTSIIQADIKTCVDANGQPLIGAPANVVPDPDDPEKLYTKVFRCYVIKMRTPPADPTIPTRESVAHGEHTIDEYWKHHGIKDAYPDLTTYEVNQTLGGTNVLLHAADDCDGGEATADDDSLSTLVDLATQHHAGHHGIQPHSPFDYGPHSFGPCACGRRFGESACDAQKRLG